MKKKVLLMLTITALMLCLFAISVNAEYNNGETVTVALSNGTTQSCALYDADGNELVWYTLDGGATLLSVKTSDLFSNDKGNKLVDSSSLTNIYLNATTALQKHGDNTTNYIVVANLRGCTFKTVTHSGYKSTFHSSKLLQYVYLPNTITNLGCNIFQSCSTVKVIDIPSDAVFTIDDANGFNGCSSLAEINLIGCSRIGSSSGHHSVFNGCTSLTRVIIDPDKYTGTILAGNLFNGCPLTQFGLVPNECHIPDTVEHMGVNVFKYSRFTKVYFGDALKKTEYNVFDGNTNLTDVYFNANYETMDQRAFMNCTALQRLHGLENTKLTAITNEAFMNSQIEEIILPNTVVSIAQSAFGSFQEGGNTNGTKIVLGAGFTTFTSYDGFKNFVALKEVYIPAGCTSIPGNIFNAAAVDCVFYFTGTKGQLDTLKANTNGNNTAFLDAYKQAISIEEFNKLETKSGRYIVYDYNQCDAFYNGIHQTTQINPCVASCSVCKSSVETHVSDYETLVVEYALGFLYDGEKRIVCANEGCTFKVAEALAPLFECLGLSANKYGNGFTVGYRANRTSIEKYSELTNSTVAFGVFAVSKDKLGTNDIFDENGQASDGVISHEIKGADFSIFEIKIVGFSDAQKSAKLAVGAYAAVKKDGTTVYSYMQDKAPLDGAKYHFTSYEEALNK